MSASRKGENLSRLVDVMRRLLAPDGCPWDREQSLESLRPYVIEEAHEVVDAIDRGDMTHLKEELGDLLLQVVFQAELAADHFDLNDVVEGIHDKLVRRHPHVFGDAEANDSSQVRESWEAIKAKEKSGRGVLSGVPVAMPALLRAWRVGEKAASIGIDWTDEAGPRGKLDEELGELDQAIERADAPGASEAAVGEVTAELGDALFSLVNLARKRGIDPEAALRGTIDRFAGRVARVESLCRARSCSSADLDASTLDALWAQAKAASNEGS